MINHVRTLLLNRDGSKASPPSFFGEQYVPPDYLAVPLPGYLQSVRSVLFGANPDRQMMNYRLAQLLPSLHSTELASHVLAYDSRVTYLGGEAAVSAAENYAPRLETAWTVNPGDVAYSVIGEPEIPDGGGQMSWEYSVAVTDDEVTVKQLNGPGREFSTLFPGGVSAEAILSLPGCGFSFRILHQNVGASIDSVSYVSALLRPSADLSLLVAGLEALSESVMLSLFGPAPSGDYLTYRNLWRRSRNPVYRMGAVLLATASRTEELRIG